VLELLGRSRLDRDGPVADEVEVEAQLARLRDLVRGEHGRRIGAGPREGFAQPPLAVGVGAVGSGRL
jgi:hypothetical protein